VAERMVNSGGRLSAEGRKDQLEQMASKQLDVLVIGGGITGAGILWDAGLRGMSAGLVEKSDFASGTSSRSTKLIHGGLRYLARGEIGLVREVGSERMLLHERLPHLVEPLPVLLPIYRGGKYGFLSTSLGIALYDRLAGVKPEDRRRMYRRGETLMMEPLLRPEGLLGAGVYMEYRTDDARLTIEIIKSAARNGAHVCHYAEVTDLLYRNGRAAGVRVRDRLSGDTYALYARKIVNAAGPWADQIRRLDQSSEPGRLLLSKGVHLVVARERLPIGKAVYFDAPDRRMVFAIPRGNKTYIGTTETIYEGDAGEPSATVRDAEYLLDAVNRVFPAVRLQLSDIESAWAGVRPLIREPGKALSDISRKDEIFVSPSGLISIAGGKLTGFRKMAAKVVDLIARQLEDETGVIYPPCTTDRSPISGGPPFEPSRGASEQRSGAGTGEQDDGGDARDSFMRQAVRRGIAQEEAAGLWTRYGWNAHEILQYFDDLGTDNGGRRDDDRAGKRLLLAELGYSMDREMTVRAADFLSRRTGWMIFDRERAELVSGDVIAYMSRRLGWDDARVEREWSELLRERRSYTVQD